jgi:outer membrane receptor protein involved in Fe transport
MRIAPFLAFSISALALHAQTPAPDADPTPADNAEPVALDPLVVSDKLDRAREAIVPSLGASSYELNFSQLAAQPQGVDASFNDVLLRVPGVANDSGNQVHLRGEHANLQYRINDVLLPEGISGFGQELDPRFIETMQVLTGALPAQYGYRTSGVVDIHTKRGASIDNLLSVYGGAHDTLRPAFEFGGATGRVDAYVDGSYETTSRGLENPTSAREPLHDHSTQGRAFGYFSLLLNPQDRLNLIVSGSAAQFEIPNVPGQVPAYPLAGVPVRPSATLDERQRESNAYTVVAYQHSGEETSYQAVAFTRASRLHFLPDVVGDLQFSGVASDVHRSVAAFGVEFDGRWSPAPAHTLRGGLLVTTNRAATDSATSVFNADETVAPTSDLPHTIAQAQRKRSTIYGVYAQDEWALNDRLTINAGARADGVSAYRREGQLSPRVNAVFTFDERTSLHAGYARYFTPPPLELLQVADPGLFVGTTNAPAVTTHSPVRSERSHYFDVGVTRKLTDAFSVNVDTYLKHARQQLDEGQFGRAIIYSPFNYERGRVYGVELSANYSRHQFSAYANLAVSRATGQAIVSGEFQFDPEELDYIRTHAVHLDHDQLCTASGGVSYTWRKTLFYADVTYGSGLRRDFANTGGLPGYAPVNVGLEHTWKLAPHRRLRLRLDLVNVFDDVYELRDGSGIGVGAPQFGERRSLYGGASVTF